MKFFDIDWTEVFGFLPLWNAMRPSSRKAFLNPAIPHSQSIQASAYGDELNPMVAAGLIQASAGGRFKPTSPSGALFRRILMQMLKFPLFDPPSGRQQIEAYVSKHFLNDDACLMNFSSRNAAATPHSVAWFREFVASKDLFQWEEAFKGYVRDEGGRGNGSVWRSGERAKATYLTSDAVAEATRSLVKLALCSPGPLALRTLCDGTALGVDARTAADAFKAAVRYLLIFPALRNDTCEAVFWIRPTIGAHLHRITPVSPKSVDVSGVSVPPFLLEDTTLVVSRAMAETLPVKKNSWGIELYEKTRRNLLEAFDDLPKSIASHHIRDARLNHALDILGSLKFIAQDSLGLTPTKAGIDWLKHSPTDRQKILIDAFRQSPKRTEERAGTTYKRPRAFSPMAIYMGERFHPKPVDTEELIVKAWSQAKPGEFFALEEWLTYHSKATLPSGVEPDTYVTDSSTNWHTPFAEGGNDVFRKLHSLFFFTKLMPLGGVCLGSMPDGQLAFSLNETGDYLIRGTGLPKGLDAEDASIVVQPNFEIVFMRANPLAEAELSKFAERCGHRIGTLFRLTKASVLKAARLGKTDNQVLEILDRTSNKPVPANERHQIHDWIKVCRHVEYYRAINFSVPDEETSQRVIQAFGEKCHKIAPLILELRTPYADPTAMKKLDSLGIFLRET